MFSISQRVLTLLQFTRLALVFTAISNSWAAMLLQAHALNQPLEPVYCVAMTFVSIGLYTFGMTLNDLIDRRRDRQIASDRPLPSGRISVRTAHLICIVTGLFAIGSGVWLCKLHPGQWTSLVILISTMTLIAFYDIAGKYLVGLGLLTLGLIRFFHASIPAPSLAIPWQSILLLLHVSILSAVCYKLEGKRPRLTPIHIFTVSAGLIMILTMLGAVFNDRARRLGIHWTEALAWNTSLYYVLAAIGLYILLALYIRWRSPDARTAGRKMMLYGLLWLIVYDAAFVMGYVGWKWALVILALLPVAWLSVKITRWWSRLLEISAKPQYQRAR